MTHYTINPLDWVDSNDGWFTARNVVGTYLVGPAYEYPGLFYVYAGARAEEDSLRTMLSDVDDAKAWCQSIHDERVASLLSPV